MDRDSGQAKPVRIGVDGYNLALPAGTGVATYARGLCRDLTSLGYRLDLIYGLQVSPKSRADMRESLFFARLGDDPAQPPPPSLRRMVKRMMMSPLARDLIEIPASGHVIAPEYADRVPPFDRLFTRGGIFDVSARFFRRFGRFMTLRMPDPPAIMHWSYPLPLRLEGAANIYTIHDLVPLRLPHTSLEDKVYYDRLIGRCITDGDHICTVSESSRNDIVSMYPVDPAKVTNSYQSVDIEGAESIADGDLDHWLDRLFDLPLRGYFLFFGAIEPKKNLGRLIQAYIEADLKAPLVIVGRQGWRSDRELRLLNGGNGRSLPGAANIRQIDYLPRSMLLRLVQGARAVLFPSLYEGFGLPAAEAMALGVPVLTSNTSSLPEIAGNAALTVDPYDPGAIARALRLLDGDAELRKRLSSLGPAHIERFSGKHHQAALDKVHRLVIEQTSGHRH